MIRLTNDQAIIVMGLLTSAGDRSNSEQGSIVDSIQEQLSTPTHDDDIIGLVERLFTNTNRVRNILIDGRLANLRAALYSPQELRRFDVLSQKLVCGSCERDLAAGEAVSTSDGTVYCSHCIAITSTRCLNCNDNIDITDSWQRMVKRSTKDCNRCNGRAVPKKAEDVEPVERLRLNNLSIPTVAVRPLGQPDTPLTRARAAAQQPQWRTMRNDQFGERPMFVPTQPSIDPGSLWQVNQGDPVEVPIEWRVSTTAPTAPPDVVSVDTETTSGPGEELFGGTYFDEVDDFDEDN